MIISINKKRLALSILIPLLVGGASSLLTRGDMKIYDEIDKPPLAPPGLLFPIAWGILYILMGISLYLVWNKNDFRADKSKAYFFFGMSLFLNFIWSPVFFSMKAFLPAFVILLLLLVSVILTIVEYYKIDRAAAFLQLPYLVWLLFAGYLNLAIYYLNG